MKFQKKFKFLIALVTALIFLGGGFLWWNWAVQPITNLKSDSKIFVIKKGEGLDSIAKRLSQEGLVKSALAFKITILNQGLANKIQAGDFRLNPSLSTSQIADTLTRGTLDVWLTFPEGWRKEEFSQRLSANLKSFNSQEFINLTEGLEGFLFPDTYLIPQNASASAVVRILNQNFDKNFLPEFEENAQTNGLNKNQIVVLASIVEREARKDEDRKIVAGILIKRWQNDWPLQADATIQYAVGNSKLQITNSKFEDWWPTITKADLQIDSLYNTYKNKGLPPTPICSPGLASIKAVVYPQESDYWFYLSDSQGITHYAKTNLEQSQNIEKYLR